MSNNTRKVLIETIPAVMSIISEAKADGPTRIRCDRMSVCDEATENNRIYPYSVWAREVSKLQEKIEAGALIGAADHPADGKSRITGDAAAAIKWDKIALAGKTTIGEGVIVPTAAG